MKERNNTDFDIEAKLFMFILRLKEEKNKVYSIEECEEHIAYIFDNEDDFRLYFLKNGIDISEDIFQLCKMKTTKKGTIIALKGICDHTIKRYKMGKELTQTQIDEIHARGKITPLEKVKEWENLDLCAPGNAIGSAKDRCHTFSNCHECLMDYASSQDEYDSIEDDLKIVNMDLEHNDIEENRSLSYKKSPLD